MKKIQMQKRVVVGLFLIGLLALAACQPGTTTKRSVSYSRSVSGAPVSPPMNDAQRALNDAATVARWQAMGQHYVGVAEAARVRNQSAELARWQAMGQHYAGLAEAAKAKNQAAEVARWQAMGQHYVGLAEAARARNQAAEVARWQALAEFYAGQDRLTTANR